MRVLIPFALVAALSAGGCAAPTTALDTQMGQALTAARAAQVVDPDAPSRARAPGRTDGQASKSSIDRYQKSFDAPPAPVNVLNIGIGSGGGGSSN